MNWLMFKDDDAETLESWNNSATECVRNVSSEVDEVSLNYGSVSEKTLGKIDTRQARYYMEGNQFERGSMLPKFEAAIDFVELGRERRAIITSIPRAKAAYMEKAGTLIVKEL